MTVRAARWALAAVVAGLGVVCVRHAMDFPVYYDAAIRAAHGDPGLYDLPFIAEGIHYRYAPALALLLFPLTWLPLNVASFLWYLLKVVTLGVLVRVGVRLSGFSGAPEFWVFGIAFLLAGAYVVEEFATGNIHFLAIACVVVGLYQAERGRVALPSGLLALAILAKVTPALALPYLAVRRQWRVLAGTLVAFVVLSAAPALVVGPNTTMTWLHDWGQTVFSRTEPRPDEHDDSFKGALVRYLSDTPAPRNKYPSVRIARVPERIVLGIWAGVCVLALVLLFRIASDRRTTPPGRAFEYALLIVAMLLLSPHSTRIYYSALFFPYVVLTIAALRSPPGRPRQILRAALGVSFVANTLVPALLPSRAVSLAYQAGAPFVWTSMLAFALLFVVANKSTDRQPNRSMDR